jgi:hypothetical protein
MVFHHLQEHGVVLLFEPHGMLFDGLIQSCSFC